MNCIELKVVFIVPTVYLVTQQKAMFEKYLPYKTMAVSGDASSSQVCLIAHLGGSSIATIIVLEESPDPVFFLNCPMNFVSSQITFPGLLITSMYFINYLFVPHSQPHMLSKRMTAFRVLIVTYFDAIDEFMQPGNCYN